MTVIKTLQRLHIIVILENLSEHKIREVIIITFLLDGMKCILYHITV